MRDIKPRLQKSRRTGNARMAVLMRRAWKRVFAVMLLMTIVSSVAAADRACPPGDVSAASGASRHGDTEDHEEEVPTHDPGMGCQMMLTCGSAVSMQSAELTSIHVVAAAPLPIVAPHYSAPHLRQESPPPKRHA